MKKTKEITKQEIDAIKFYLGDQETVNKGIYRGGDKAYTTINALLNLGISDELLKIKEGKKIEIYDEEHLKSYINVIISLYSAMCKYLVLTGCSSEDDCTSYKVDRTNQVNDSIIKGRRIYGNFSTCKNGFLPYYAHQKIGITLLEVVRSKNLPYLDIQKILGEEYSKPEEVEILLPTYCIVDKVYSEELSEKEKLLTDKNGNIPDSKKIIYLSKTNYPSLSEEEIEKLYNYVTSKNNVDFIIETMNTINKSDKLSTYEIARYSKWKGLLHKYIYGTFSKIEKEVLTV